MNALMNCPIDGVIDIPNNVFIILCDIVLNINDDQGFVHCLLLFLFHPPTVACMKRLAFRSTFLLSYNYF